MKFCQHHWNMMRDAIEARGMTALVAPNGRRAVENLVDETKHGQTVDNFDPLMAMHWNVAGNLLNRLGASAGYLLSCCEGQEDAIDVQQISDVALKAKYIGKKWPLCPVCYTNIAHELTCTNPKCTLTRENGYDICIEWAADGVKQTLDDLMAGKK